MRINFQKIGIFLVIMGMAFFAQQLFPSNASALDKATMQLHWKCSGMHVPFIVAWDKGFFKDEGIDMTVKDYRACFCTPAGKRALANMILEAKFFNCEHTPEEQAVSNFMKKILREV